VVSQSLFVYIVPYQCSTIVPHGFSGSPVDNLLNSMVEFQPANPCEKLSYAWRACMR
jgi:hypothetical protein